MNINEKFNALSKISFLVRSKQNTKQKEFLNFFKTLIETIPTEVCTLFGGMSVDCIDANRQKQVFGIELSVADYLYWTNAFSENVKFTEGFEKVKVKMLHHLAVSLEKACDIDPADRKAVLDLLTSD